MSKWYTYDAEVFAHDFIIGFKDRETGEYTHFHNDNEGVRDFFQNDAIYCGFNSKSYDQYIIKAVVAGFSPEEVKQVNDWIIAGHQGWQCPLLDGVYFKFNNIDIKNDVRLGLGLKAIEAHLGLNIRESEVDFDLDRPLTFEEIQEVIEYNKADLDATEKLTEIRKDYLRTKLNLGKRAGIDGVTALSLTNAKLTAKMLRAEYLERNDGRDYVYPPNLDLSVIPKEILDFFDTIHDKSIPDDKLFGTNLQIDIGGMPCTFAWGGVHGSLSGYFEEAKGTRVIQNRDVSSLYPSLIEGYNYLSRNVPDPQLFYDIRKDRIKAKHDGDKQTANDLKLPLNTVSGAQENQYNDLYDPLPTRSMRISGQLFLTMLTMQLLNACKTIKLLNLNTDGLMYSIDSSETKIVDIICAKWERQTGFELETDDISKVWLKDVNNLLFVKTDGKVKTVGGYLNYGISVKGAWAINNTMPIVKKALVEYFAHDVPVETTINECEDIFDFQIITSAGDMYKSTFHLVDGEYLPIQKVNRVYATSDERYGKLYKLKDGGNYEQFGTLPDHCIIDNDNTLTIDKVDRAFYIELAKKRINDYMGIKPEKKGRKKKMAETKTKMNVYQKLIKARADFLKANIEKSGKNIHLAFKYFELDDIVPVATKIFNEIGIVPLVNFTENMAVMEIVDADNPDDRVGFTAPVVRLSENKGTNAVQAFGATITYYRRYLYMLALDICEPDEIDNGVQDTAPAPKQETKPAPTQSLTDSNSNASELQIKQLKELLKKLRDADASKEEFIANIAVETQGFKVISKADCETLVAKVSEMLNGGAE